MGARGPAPRSLHRPPLLIERIEHDDSIRVRRMAVAMLAHHVIPDERVVPVFEGVLADDSDRKLRLHATNGLDRYREAGLAVSA
ncbi:MAG: HEAT repeat domain-containing protein [Gemmatimonadetes bacterium]|nr:HEAT repeat domain-containing protein [Gemmatimonadota bacterium]